MNAHCAGSSGNFSRQVVLVIEDNTVTRRSFRAALESNGFDVVEVGDGKSALEAVARERPTVIVQDLTLPDTDGLDLLARLRALPAGGQVPVIATSGFVPKLEEARSVAAGFSEHLVKPVDPVRLVQAVRAHSKPVPKDRPGAGRRVLVADDDPIQRRLLALVLERAGFEVVSAKNGEQALALARTSKPDVILSDILMPGMDGFRLCEAVRGDATLRDVPVVLVSGAFTEEADLRLARSVGASDLLVRGSDHEPIVEALLASLGRPGAASVPSPLRDDDYTQRMIRQLERQLSEQANLASRLALHEAAMAVLARMGESARRGGSFDELLPELLDSTLDAAGIALGAVYIARPDGRLELRAQRGFLPSGGVATFFGQLSDLERAGPRLEPVAVPAKAEADPAERELLARAGAGSLLLVPLRVGTEPLGVLVLAAVKKRIGAEWLAFSGAVGVQMSQAIALARAVAQAQKTEAQLWQAQKMEAVGRLAGGVAHDFNNLLTGIMGYSELVLARMAPGDPRRGEIEEIRRAGERAASLTRQLLLFSRHEAVKPQVLDANAIVSDMERLLRRLIGEDVSLRVSLAPDAGHVEVDRGHLEQVLLNLCVNARDAMPDGGTLELSTRNHEGKVVLSVRDSGCGMTPEVLAHLFEPFFTTKEAGKGTGLGLSTVYGIVRGAGGRVAVSSEVGKGSTFEVHLPRVEKSLPGPVRTETAPPATGRETILVVEDEDIVRDLAQLALEMHGYDVLVAPGPRYVAGVLDGRTDPIHLLVTDVVMPGMSGPELARGLVAERPGLKVVYTSGYTGGALQKSGVAGDGFLQKPFTPSQLAKKVREVLDGK